MVPAFSVSIPLVHDPEKWEPVFGQDHAQRITQRITQRIIRRTTMPRKPGLNSEFVMFDVVYEDGTQRSNRKVPRELTAGLEGDKAAHGFLIEQDREIAEKSGRA